MSSQDGLDGTIVLTPNKEGRIFMSSHEFDTWLDLQPLEEPSYYEQLLLMQEVEEVHDTKLRQQGAITALQNLMITLSVLILRDDVQGDYLFGLHHALEIARGKLDIMRGGVA